MHVFSRTYARVSGFGNRRLSRWARFPEGFDRLTIRAALFVGFWLIFGLWLVSGFVLVRRLKDVESRAAAIHLRFNQNEQLLLKLRTDVLLGAVYLRDAILETGLREADYYRDRLKTTRAEIEKSLRDYVPVVDSPEERENWTRLQSEIRDYWNTALPVLGWEPIRRASEARTFLLREVIPKRDLIIRISDRIQVLNREAFRDQQAAIAVVYRDMRQRVWWTSGLAIVLGLGIALLVTRYAGALEGHIRQQHLQDQQNKRDLQRLSARLVHAQEEERGNIARELHDEIGQALTAIKMDLAMAERNLGERDPARAPLHEARGIADRTLQAVRDLSHLLHPSMLDDLGLPATLDWYLRGFTRRTGIRTELIQERIEGRFAPEVEVCAYRIVQEAMTNVLRHANATCCRVYLQRLPHTLLVTVEDDGKGFEPQRLREDSQRGLGLVGIQERATGLGGTFRLESRIGKGTRISVELPAVVSSLDGTEMEPEAPAVPASPRAE